MPLSPFLVALTLAIAPRPGEARKSDLASTAAPAIQRASALAERTVRRVVQCTSVANLDAELDAIVDEGDGAFVTEYLSIMEDLRSLDLRWLGESRDTVLRTFARDLIQRFGEEHASTIQQGWDMSVDLVVRVTQDDDDDGEPSEPSDELKRKALRAGVAGVAMVGALASDVDLDRAVAAHLIHTWHDGNRAILHHLDDLEAALERARVALPEDLRRHVVRITYLPSAEEDEDRHIVIYVVLDPQSAIEARGLTTDRRVHDAISKHAAREIGKTFVVGGSVYFRQRLATDPGPALDLLAL